LEPSYEKVREEATQIIAGKKQPISRLAEEGEGLGIVDVDRLDCRVSTDLIQSRKPGELRAASG